MRLINFRIKNYKSIVDSLECSFSSDLTILIGKNESGKSATLEALRDFDRSIVRMADDVYPLDGRTDEPTVEVQFQIQRDELGRIQEQASVTLSDEIIECILQQGITIAKNGRGKYSIKDEYLQYLSADYKGSGQSGLNDGQTGRIQSAKNRIAELMENNFIPGIDLQASTDDIRNAANELTRAVKSSLALIKEENIQQEVVENLRVIIKEIKALDDYQAKPKGNFIDGIVQNMPNFIFFDEFNDILPFEVDIAAIKDNQSVLNFAKIAQLDLDRVIETKDFQRRINLLNRHSAAISTDFVQYWGQNRIELVIKPAGEKLLFGIRDCETNEFFKVEQRSKGFRWFLSFYLKLNAQSGENNIIIIDEPGINLHAKAQKEIINMLVNKIAPQAQVVFSTHSPYFIDAKRLDRVRLVINKPFIGTVLKKYLECDADEETLTPITTVKGTPLFPADTLMLNTSRYVICPSTSAYYYLKALNLYLDEIQSEELNLIPTADKNSMLALISMMVAQNSEFILLLENTDENIIIASRIKEKLAIEDERIIFVSEETDFFIEDLFTQDDFKRFVLNDGANRLNLQTVNSKYLILNKINQAQTAKSFFDKVDKIQEGVPLSEATIAAFKEVFDKIRFSLNGPSHTDEKVEEDGDREDELSAEEEQQGQRKPDGSDVLNEKQEEEQSAVKRRSLFSAFTKK